MAYKSLYNDIANKVTGSIGKRRLLLSQIETGAEDSKPLEGEILLSSKLDRTGSDTYPALTMNPDRDYAVISNNENTKAYNRKLNDLHYNKMRAVNMSGSKNALSGLVTGMLANNFGMYFVYKHQTPSVATARVILNLLEKADSYIVKPIATLTGNSLVIKGFATVANSDITTGVTLATRTLEVGRTYTYFMVYGGTTSASSGISRLYENGVLIYQNTAITYHAEFIASILAGVELQPALEGLWLRFGFTNFAPTVTEASYVWNNGRPDLFIVPDSWRWGSNTNLITLGFASNEFFIAPTDDGITYHSGSGKATLFTIGSVAKNIYRFIPGEVFGKRYKIVVWTKAGTASITAPRVAEPSSQNVQVTLTKETNPDGSGWDRWTGYYVCSNASVGLFMIISGTEGQTYWVDDVSVIQEGIVADYNAAGMVQSLGATATTTVVSGTAYEITADITALEATAIGALDNLVGSRFTAIASATLSGTGRVKPVIVSSVIDASTNALNATTSGEPVLNNVQVETIQGDGIGRSLCYSEYLDASAGANVGNANLLPPKWFVSECILYNYGAGSATIKIGSTNGGGEYVSAKTIAAGEIIKFSVPDTLDPYSLTDFSPFYLNSASWGSAKVKAEFRLTKSNNNW